MYANIILNFDMGRRQLKIKETKLAYNQMNFFSMEKMKNITLQIILYVNILKFRYQELFGFCFCLYPC